MYCSAHQELHKSGFFLFLSMQGHNLVALQLHDHALMKRIHFGRECIHHAVLLVVWEH